MTNVVDYDSNYDIPGGQEADFGSGLRERALGASLGSTLTERMAGNKALKCWAATGTFCAIL